MIYFNEKDYHLLAIKKDSKLTGVLTKINYHVFGLALDEDNPAISVFYPDEIIDSGVRINDLLEFVSRNKIEASFEAGSGRQGCRIGLRKDLRKDVILASCLLQTIIYFLEGRLDLPKDYQIPGLSKFIKEQNKNKKLCVA